MTMRSKNQGRVGRQEFFSPDDDVLRKYNYSTGAGWKKNPKKSKPANFNIKSKRRAFNHAGTF